MITARDIADSLKARPDPVVDRVISQIIGPRFIRSRGGRVAISERSVAACVAEYTSDLFYDNRGGAEWFIEQMKLREFYIHRKCDDHPCGDFYFHISLYKPG